MYVYLYLYLYLYLDRFQRFQVAQKKIKVHKETGTVQYISKMQPEVCFVLFF